MDCPTCGNPAEIVPPSAKDCAFVKCAKCGSYGITGTEFESFFQRNLQTRLGQLSAAKCRSQQGGLPLVVSPEYPLPTQSIGNDVGAGSAAPHDCDAHMPPDHVTTSSKASDMQTEVRTHMQAAISVLKRALYVGIGRTTSTRLGQFAYWVGCAIAAWNLWLTVSGLFDFASYAGLLGATEHLVTNVIYSAVIWGVGRGVLYVLAAR